MWIWGCKRANIPDRPRPQKPGRGIYPDSLTYHECGLIIPAAPTHAGMTCIVSLWGCRNWRGIAQPGSASALGAEGREFESLCPDQICEYLHTQINTLHGVQHLLEEAHRASNSRPPGRNSEYLHLQVMVTGSVAQTGRWVQPFGQPPSGGKRVFRFASSSRAMRAR